MAIPGAEARKRRVRTGPLSAVRTDLRIADFPPAGQAGAVPD